MKRMLLAVALVLAMCSPASSGFTSGGEYQNLDPVGDWYFLPQGGQWEYQENYGEFEITLNNQGNFIVSTDTTVWIYDYDEDEWSLLYNDNFSSPGANVQDYPFQLITNIDGAYFL